MKKCISITIVVLLLIFTLFGCSSNNTDNTEASSENVLHTIAPQNQTNDTEWSQVGSDVFVYDKDNNELLDKTSFSRFALVGNNDDDSYILLELTDEAIDMMKTLYDSYKDSKLTLYVSDKKIAKFKFDIDVKNGKIIIGQDKNYNKLCEIASDIRGVV